jgi:hypothetical protein
LGENFVIYRWYDRNSLRLYPYAFF